MIDALFRHKSLTPNRHTWSEDLDLGEAGAAPVLVRDQVKTTTMMTMMMQSCFRDL